MKMSYSYSPWLLPLLITCGVLLVLWWNSYKRKEQSQAFTFMWLMVSLLVWTVCYTLGLASDDIAGKIFWLRLKYLGSASAPILWFIFSLQFTQNSKKLTRIGKVLLGGFYLLTLGVVFTSSWQTWMWGEIWIEPGFLEEQVTHGWFFWVYVAISYFFILVSAWMYVRFVWRVPEISRKQSILMALGGIIPLLGRIALDGFGLDLVPQLDEVILFFLASAILFSVALFRYNLLQIMPIAYAQVIHSMQIGVIVLDRNKLVLDINPAAQRMIGLGTADFQGQPLNTMWEQANELIITPDGMTDMILQVDKGTQFYQIRSSIIGEPAEKPLGYLLLLTDITLQKKDSLALETLAKEDGLTGLLNRRTFMDMAAEEHQRALRYQFSYAFIMFDLDFFKQVNDTYGHQSGDVILQAVSYRCKSALRSIDLIGRYGGEEFVVLLPNTDSEGALVVAEKLRTAIGETPIIVDKTKASLTVTISLGLAIFDSNDKEDHPDLKTILSRADKMLYASKVNGRDRISLWPGESE